MPRVHVEALDGSLDPVLAVGRLLERPGLLWLDAERTPRGRYAFVGADPVEVRRRHFGEGAPWSALEGLARPEDDAATGAVGPPPERVPHWAGYLAYDATWAEGMRIPPAHPRPPQSPVLWLGRYDAWACFDRIDGRAWIVGDDPAACARLRRRLRTGPSRPPLASAGAPTVDAAALHVAAIRRAMEHIAAGDVYQVNLARRWAAPLLGAPAALAIAMHRASPVPLGFFLDAGDHAVVTRSMETFLEWEGPGGRLRSRPIKGTIARHGRDGHEAATLRTDTKERAEHAMIVDLMRNDLGRVAVPGSVRVDEVMAVEPYTKLSHLVSTVSCTTRPEGDVRRILRATFPPGSVTGTPKLRAVELIEALERGPRGVYCGAVGHVARTGGMHWAVAIRTAQVAAGEAVYHAGGGIVEASDPDREVAETELKARAFLDALSLL
ncbi:MAG: anthranilate synthase component I family protein [Myxococcota bacterium]